MDSEKLNDRWSAVKAQILGYPDVNAAEISAFFSRLEPQAMSDSFLMLTAGNEFIKTWVEDHYLASIQRALFDMTGTPFAVAIAVDPTQEQRQTAQAGAATAAPSPAAAAPVMAQAAGAAVPLAAPATPATPITAGAGGGLNPVSAVAAGAEPCQVVEVAAPSTVAPVAEPQPFSGAPATPPSPASVAPAGAIETSEASRAAASPAPSAPVDPAAGDQPSSTLTFSNFVIGESNQMAYSMANEVAGNPGRPIFNPLFIYGKSGLGKTHLMLAIKNYIDKTQPHLRTVYADSADFVSKYMEASVAHDREKASFKNFKHYYEEADVLLIDDIQYLQNKKQCLDMVFQLFNSLTAQGKQVVLSADRAPKNIDVDDRYSSRFSSGGIVEVRPPDIETKLAIVKRFAEECSRNEGFSQCAIPDDIQMYIAENSSSNIRELLSAVTNVLYRMVFSGQSDMTIEGARVLLENHFSGGMSRNLSAEDIQREVENFFKVSHADLLSAKRSRSIAYPRQIAIYLCRQLLDVPYEDIGRKFNRDHSTAIYAVGAIEEKLKKERDVQEEVETLQKILSEL
ncbi:chromosomal replication initiator protein DnaA [Adlercreutzia mucosicola]|uniref:chromosomal replication initiator protein DnaA n=1 Tax=Adlercreutzia mucosicola TaxID=580026 RepID=UPI00041FF394|nr:chromosomal replication initiator protein DnaA [Adlercreutzia mucosicola]MCR2034040.1 chromosomal replication initiator protein DnaA [Adlercreutzia mucosicola]